MEQEARRLLIRDKLRDGCLPYEGSARIYGAPGTGTGEPCGACEQPLVGTQLVMVVPWRPHKTFVKLYADCYVLWNEERDGRPP